MQSFVFGTRSGNRTHNNPLGGGRYIHLTMQAYGQEAHRQKDYNDAFAICQDFETVLERVK